MISSQNITPENVEGNKMLTQELRGTQKSTTMTKFMMSQVDQTLQVSSSDSDQEDMMQVSRNTVTQDIPPQNSAGKKIPQMTSNAFLFSQIPQLPGEDSDSDSSSDEEITPVI